MKIITVFLILCSLSRVAGAVDVVSPNGGDDPASSYTKSLPFQAWDKSWETAAQASYWTGSKVGVVEKCTGASSDAEEAKQLVAMAQSRKSTLECGKSRVASVLTANDDTFDNLQKDVSAKLAQILSMRKEASNHENYYGEVNDDPNGSGGKEAAILASIPFYELPAVRNFVHNQLEMYNNGRGPQPNFAQVEKSVGAKSGFFSALVVGERNIDDEISRMDKGIQTKGASLALGSKESLLQDPGLYKTLGQKFTSPQERAATCNLNAKYGAGAKGRDIAITSAQIGFTVATLGTSGIAAGSSQLALNGERAAQVVATAGKYAGNSAKILGQAALYSNLGPGVLAGAKRCTNGQHLQAAGEDGASCDKFPIEELKRNNCVLYAIMTAGGVVASSAKGRELLGRLMGVDAEAQGSVAGGPKAAAEPELPTQPKPPIPTAIRADLDGPADNPLGMAPIKMKAKYVGEENGKELWNPEVTGKDIYHTQYFRDPEKLESLKITPTARGADGASLLQARDANGNLVLADTSNAPNQEALLAFDKTGKNLYMYNFPKKFETHHSSLLSGDEGLFAGKIKVINGRVKLLTNDTGHYPVSRKRLDAFAAYLRKQGIGVDEVSYNPNSD